MDSIPSGFKIVVIYIILMLSIGLFFSFLDLFQKKHRFTLRNICILWTAYTLDFGLRISVYILATPLILALLVLQPIMTLAFLIAIVLLIIYCIGLFLEEPFVGNPPSSKEALWALVTIASCIVIWLLATKIFKSEDKLLDRYTNFFIERVQHPMQQRILQLKQKMED